MRDATIRGQGENPRPQASQGDRSPDRISFDFRRATLEVERDGDVRTLDFSSAEAFDVISRAWLRVGWDTKHVYSFTWMGRPVIQLPEDLVRLQEVIYRVRPDVIIETGIAHGGGLVFHASLCKAMGRGRVIGIDVEIRPPNRAAVEAHELSEYITMIEGDSVAPDVVAEVASLVEPGAMVLVTLDSKHTKDHVLAELQAYAPLVSVGSYIVAADGIMADLVGAPRAHDDWAWNNPKEAAAEFLRGTDDFVLDPPTPIFNEGVTATSPTYWPGGWLRRVQ